MYVPIRALLVQHAIPTLLAANGVALLQRDLLVALAAQVGDGLAVVVEGLRAASQVEAAAGAGAAGLLLGGTAEGGGLVLFARHFG